ncbi:MAG: hypothetical protein Kow00124_27030 [Anaerolineae bacterium]
MRNDLTLTQKVTLWFTALVFAFTVAVSLAPAFRTVASTAQPVQEVAAYVWSERPMVPSDK